MLNKFLGGEYFLWGTSNLKIQYFLGIETLLSLIRGEEWKESPIFPRVIMCDFSVGFFFNLLKFF